jgi:alpha-beta hydrolase superfamily lysophospholipase
MAALLPLIAAAVGKSMRGGILRPLRLHQTPARREQADQMLARTTATRRDFAVKTQDGVELHGWKVDPPSPTGNWVLLFHGVSDNRTGVLGHAEFLVRHGYSVLMMDAREHGDSGGEIATYGWKERHDTVAIADALYAAENVRCLTALGVSMGAAIALQAAAIEPRIAGVVAEAPFSNLREVSYDYTGLHISPWLGKTLFRPASIFGLGAAENEGAFRATDVSPEKAVAARAFPILLICGTKDHTIPCRHAERIYTAAQGPKQLWIVKGAGHAAALGHAPADYEARTVAFFAGACPAH